MPIMNGLEATRCIRLHEEKTNRYPTPIVGVSGNTSKSQIQEALKIGMNAYIKKPLQQSEVYEKVEKFCGSKSSEKQLMQEIDKNELLAATYADKFKKEVAELVSHKFPFELIYQKNLLIIILSTMESNNITPYLGRIILNDLKQKIENILRELGIQSISLSNNQLLIQATTTKATLEIENCLINSGLCTARNENENKQNKISIQNNNLDSTSIDDSQQNQQKSALSIYPCILFPSSSNDNANSKNIDQESSQEKASLFHPSI